MIVYAGAIMVLFVFVIMLLNAGVEERTDFSKIAKYAGPAAGHFPDLDRWRIGWRIRSSAEQIANGARGTEHVGFHARSVRRMLFQKYLFPFEATSILILIAILGALVLAKKDE